MHSRTLVWLCLTLFFVACTKGKEELQPGDTATSGAFELLADETLRPCIDSLITGFNITTPKGKVTVKYVNATDALDALINQKARLVLIARSLTSKERKILESQKIELTEAEVAQSSIGCIVSRKSISESMSMDELRRLLNYQIVGNHWVPHHRVSTSYLSSTESVLDSIFGREKYQEGEIVRFRTTDSVFDSVVKDTGAIGFVNISWIHDRIRKGDSSFRILKISSGGGEPIMLHPAYILQGLYPLQSRICAYTTEVPNTLPRGFLAYAMAAEGQRVFLNYDLIPKTQILKLVPSQK
ncbi:MAG: substrate-binding domain-containing protein [bacterium]